MKKRGITPLIATVILIGFVVAVAVIVFVWVKGFAEETAEKEGELAEAKMACQRVDIKITKSEDIYTIENIGSETIDSFAVRKVGEDSKEVEKRLAPLSSTTERGLSSGDEIVPRIKPEGAGAPTISCTNAAKTLL